MRIETFITTTELETNTYLVTNGDRAFVVDPGADCDQVVKAAKDAQARIETVLLTHAHHDHIGCAAAMQKNGALIVMHEADVELIKSYKNMAFSMGKSVEPFVPDLTVKGGEKLSVAGIDVQIISTAGHTAGGVCYVVGRHIFSGDTLFYMSYGRTDFPSGDFKELKNSVLNKLFALTGDYKIYPGHGETTTLGFERIHNPIRFDHD